MADQIREFCYSYDYNSYVLENEKQHRLRGANF